MFYTSLIPCDYIVYLGSFYFVCTGQYELCFICLFAFWTLVQIVLHYRFIFHLQQGKILPDISMLPKKQEGRLMSRYLSYFSCSRYNEDLTAVKTEDCQLCYLHVSSSMKRTFRISCRQRMLTGSFKLILENGMRNARWNAKKGHQL